MKFTSQQCLNTIANFNRGEGDHGGLYRGSMKNYWSGTPLRQSLGPHLRKILDSTVEYFCLKAPTKLQIRLSDMICIFQ